MATTPNFGWVTPAPTDLVTDLPADFEIFADAVDASLVDLKGGTTGQVLAKASNTDMDFSWVAQDDSNAIQNAIVNAKGDLISATADDTPARLAVGTNGQVLSANSSTATGLEWVTASAGGMTTLASGSFTAATSLNLTSISGSYKDLRLVIRKMFLTGAQNNINMRINNISSAVYGKTAGQALGGALSNTEFDFGQFTTSNPESNLTIIDIPDYAQTLTFKLFTVRLINKTDATNYNFAAYTGVYGQTTAISQINIRAGSNFDTGGTYILYGVN